MARAFSPYRRNRLNPGAQPQEYYRNGQKG